jgi:hypothetical protein
MVCGCFRTVNVRRSSRGSSPNADSHPILTSNLRLTGKGYRAWSGTMADEFHVHQCPYCELRFRYATEVKDHVIHDHPDHAKSFARADPNEHHVR